MQIGLVYDLKEDYGIDVEDITYSDFCNLVEIQHIQQTLQNLGHRVIMIGSPKEFALGVQKGLFSSIELIMNFSEGFRSRNRESLVPALCELYQIPYAFSDCYAMALTLHKHQTLLFAESLGVEIPKGFLFSPLIHTQEDISRLVVDHGLSFPLIIKPNREGTSMGLALAHNMKELIAGIRNVVSTYCQEVRCDEFIPGNEIAVPIIGSGKNAQVLGIVEYQKLDGDPIECFTTNAKKKGNHKTIYQTFGEATDKIISESALLVHNSIPCYDISRMDMKLYKGMPYLLEVTPLPGMNPGSTFELCARQHGLSAEDLYARMIDSALERYR